MANKQAVATHQNIARAAFGLSLGATAINSALFTFDGGQRAILFNRFWGMIDETEGEGIHSLVPWLQKPYIFNIRIWPHTLSPISGTKDLKIVNLTLSVLSCPAAGQLPRIFQALGLKYDEKVLPSIGNEVLKSVVTQFNANQPLTDHSRISALVRESLIRRDRSIKTTHQHSVQELDRDNSEKSKSSNQYSRAKSTATLVFKKRSKYC